MNESIFNLDAIITNPPSGTEAGKMSAPHGTTAWFCHRFKVLHGTFEFVEVER